MSPDEYRPNAPLPERRRELRFEIVKHIGGAEITMTLSVEDPQSAAEVEHFFAIAGEVLDPAPTDGARA